MRNILIALVVVVLLCVGIAAAGALLFLTPFSTQITQQTGPTPVIQVATEEPTAFAGGPTVARPTQSATTPIPNAGGTPAATGGATVAGNTLEEITRADIPRNDPIEVVPRLRGEAPITFSTPAAAKEFKVGDKAPFWVSRDITGSYEQITATLRYASPVVYMWVEDGINLADADIRKGGDNFTNKIYPTDRQNLGSEWTPGVDNDPHIFIVNTRFKNAAGYFSSTDEYPRSIKPYSNEHETFYMNTDALRPGSSSFDSVLSHEFAHMIHWRENGHESQWLLEGLGDLAIRLNGLGPVQTDYFARNPDLQLDAFSDDNGPLTYAHYEAGYLFLSYSLDRFGADFMKAVVSSGVRGIDSIQKGLDKYAQGIKFDDLFADWVATNVLNGAPAAGARYAYKQDRPRITPQAVNKLPFSTNTTVSQYGTDYYEVTGQGNLTLNFSGDTTVRVIPPQAHSGKMFWWSNRADMSNTSLTRSIDLTGVKAATLKFWTWFNIEDGFDYVYVSASADGGKLWKTLKGKYTTDTDPNGANLGNGLTGHSGAPAGAKSGETWVQEQMDLTPFAGKQILLRFDYVTDDAYVAPGLALDDLEIPEINWRDDAEKDDPAWKAQGFVRIDDILPQRFIVQAIEFGSTVRVERVPLDASNKGSLTVNGLGSGVTRLIISVSGATPITWEGTNYTLDVRGGTP